MRLGREAGASAGQFGAGRQDGDGSVRSPDGFEHQVVVGSEHRRRAGCFREGPSYSHHPPLQLGGTVAPVDSSYAHACRWRLEASSRRARRRSGVGGQGRLRPPGVSPIGPRPAARAPRRRACRCRPRACAKARWPGRALGGGQRPTHRNDGGARRIRLHGLLLLAWLQRESSTGDGGVRCRLFTGRRI